MSVFLHALASAVCNSVLPQVKVAGGSILVRPLTQDWVHACGGLLTTAFADAMGYVPMYRSVTSAAQKLSAYRCSVSLEDEASQHGVFLYRTYLRHQIRQYLHRHADMPPKAIVLVALLMPDEQAEAQPSTSESSSPRRARLNCKAIDPVQCAAQAEILSSQSSFVLTFEHQRLPFSRMFL